MKIKKVVFCLLILVNYSFLVAMEQERVEEGDTPPAPSEKRERSKSRSRVDQLKQEALLDQQNPDYPRYPVRKRKSTDLDTLVLAALAASMNGADQN